MPCRIYGPYPYKHRGRVRGWRVVTVREDGERHARVLGSQAEAEKLASALRAQAADESTLSGALKAYDKHLAAKGNRPRSTSTTVGRIKAFWGDDGLQLHRVNVAALQRAYDRRRETVSVDTGRNELAEVKTFLRWAEVRGLVRRGLADQLHRVKGVGRRSRGKRQLRVDEARQWVAKATELADKGEAGAVAALCTLFLRMRASEIVSRRARDVDAGGSLLWITESKTEAGERTIAVDDAEETGGVDLRRYLLELKEGKGAEERLFGHHWRDWVRKWVQRICREAGVPEVTAHGMRGLGATLQEIGGASTADVARGLGHVGTKTADRHYIDQQAVEATRRRKGFRVVAGGKV